MNEEQKRLEEERARIAEELMSLCEAAAAAKLDFFCAVNTGPDPSSKSPLALHNVRVRINTENNHHFGDLLSALLDLWEKNNGNATSGDNHRFLRALVAMTEYWWRANHK